MTAAAPATAPAPAFESPARVEPAAVQTPAAPATSSGKDPWDDDFDFDKLMAES